MSAPSFRNPSESKEYDPLLQGDPIDNGDMPADSPAFWNNVNRMKEEAKLFSDQLDQMLLRVLFADYLACHNPAHLTHTKSGTGVMAALDKLTSPNSNISASLTDGLNMNNPVRQKDDFDRYRTFLLEHSNIIAGIGNNPNAPPTTGFEDFTNVLHDISQHKARLNSQLDRWHTIGRQVSLSLSNVNAKWAEFDESKKKYVGKMKKYLALKSTTNPETLAEKDKKIRTRKAQMEAQRFDIESTLRNVVSNKELSVLKPLSGVLVAYLEYFEAGYKVFAPIKDKILELRKHVEEQEQLVSREAGQLKNARRQWEKKTGAERRASLSGRTGAGLPRDLAGNTSANQNKATEKEGYLYFPAPNFQQVFCQLRNGYFTVHGGAKDVSVNVLLCTVKESSKDKLRYCFSIINPQQEIILQADSQSDMNDWVNVIQNAVSSSLNQNNTTGGKRNPPPHRPSYGGSGPMPAYSNGSDQSKDGVLSLLKDVPGNTMCVDCDAKNPDWMSLNLGVLMCMECSGVHRALGVHISKVRSCTLDKIDQYLVNYMRSVGNTSANNIWEAALNKGAAPKSRPDTLSNRAVREMYIRAKYELRSFLGHVEKDKMRLNELMFEAIQNDQPMELLKFLAWGADPTWPNEAEENRTALHQAVMYSNPVCVECVIQHTQKMSIQELRGWTPLHYAAYQDNPQLVELLLLRGGSSLALVVDIENQTPLETARAFNENPAYALVHLLEQAEAKARSR